MPSILIENLTEDEKRKLNIVKAKKGFDTWKEMMLKLGEETEDEHNS